MSTAETSDILARIERRLDGLEASLGRITGLLQAAGDGLGMAGDVADDAAARMQARGVDIDAHVAAALSITERLTAPHTASALVRLVDRLETLDSALASLPGGAAMVADIADAEAARLAGQGVDIDATVTRLIRMGQLLATPQVASMVDAAVRHAPTITGALDLLATAPDLTAMGLDVFDDVMRAAGDDGVDLALLAPRLRDGLVAGVAFLTSDGFSAFMEAMAEPDAFAHLVPLIRAIREATREPPEAVSVWSLLGRLRDPEMQQSLGLFLRFASAVGNIHQQQHGASKRTLEKR